MCVRDVRACGGELKNTLILEYFSVLHYRSKFGLDWFWFFWFGRNVIIKAKERFFE